MKSIISVKVIARLIFHIRGQRVMLDRDSAQLYGVTTKRLNEQVKRNRRRFPSDFGFQLNKREAIELVANCDRLNRLKHSSAYPFVFTEQVIAMLSSVLNSDRAIEVNIRIIRIFVKINELMITHKDIARKIEELERNFKDHDKKFTLVFESIRQILKEEGKPKTRIGFYVK